MIKTMNLIKNIKFGLMVTVVMIVSLSSCEEHTDEYDGSLRVGNILLADNSVVSPHGFDSKHQMAVGVIFYVNRDTALVVSTHETGYYAYADSLGTVGSIESDIRALCGAENTAALLVSEIPTPAAEAVASFSSPISSWALPSAGELRMLASALPIVENVMKQIGGEPFADDLYVSSTQDGSTSESEQMYYLSVAVRSGFVTSTIKTTPGRVRPVLRIR